MQKVYAHIVPKPTYDNFELVPSISDDYDEITLNTEYPIEQNSHYRHPMRLLNFIAESNAANLTTTRPRRAPELFKTPKIRLTCQQNTIFFKGPKLYNIIVNDINASLLEKDTKLQKRYLKPFKNSVKKYLLDMQKLGSPENWSLENFKLYNL